ncbi:MAG: hypothetical protein KDC46_00925 [Thermoleophilia bacterium]|nr:hypothetical protein [Thermoleophilia bacterium]
MNAYNNLPLPARIAIPAVLVLLLGLILWMTAFRSPAPVAILKTKDYDVYETAQKLLENKGFSPTEEADGKQFVLLLPPGDQVTDASTVLAQSGIKDRTGMAATIECPAPPGFTGTKAANERANNCEAAKAVQGMLLAAGATAANVQVSQEENGTLLGPEKSMNVVAQVFLPRSMRDRWDAEQAARAISRSVGTSINRVSITDSQLQTLFDGSSSAAAGTGTSGTSSLALGCDDIAAATEVETKRAAVRNCYEATIGEKLTRLLGGSDRFVLTVEPTIDSNSIQTTQVRNTQGPASSRSTQKGSGQSTEDVDTPPNTTERTIVNPAGDIKSLRISVVLDKNTVPADKIIAVKRLLSTQVEPKRGDPAPVVSTAVFEPGDGEAPQTELKQIQDQAKAGSSEDLPDVIPVGDPTTRTPTWMYALLGTLVAGILAAVGILWHRSSKMAAERKRMEEAFNQEQRLFENFAQQNADQLAQDLEAAFGAPSAPERNFG